MGLLCLLYRMYTVLFKVDSFRSPCFKEYIILTQSRLCFLWIGREGPAEMPKVWFLISSLQEARQHSNQVLDQRIPINCLLPTLRPAETIHLVLRGQLGQLGFEAKGFKRSIAGFTVNGRSSESPRFPQPQVAQACFASSDPFRFNVPKRGDFHDPPQLSSFWIMKNFYQWQAGLGWWVSSVQVKISQKDVNMDSLDGLCSVQSRHVQANCKFQVQQCKEGVSLLGQTLYAPTSRLHEIDMRIFSSPCFMLHTHLPGRPWWSLFPFAFAARKVLYPDSQKEIFQEHQLHTIHCFLDRGI